MNPACCLLVLLWETVLLRTICLTHCKSLVFILFAEPAGIGTVREWAFFADLGMVLAQPDRQTNIVLTQTQVKVK